MTIQSLLNRIMSGSLVLQIFIGFVAGVLLAIAAPQVATSMLPLGDLFKAALMAVAPVLVLVLVASAIANRRSSHTAQMRPIVAMYLVGTIAAALIAVLASTLFPTELTLTVAAERAAPKGIAEVLSNLLKNIVQNPISALLNGNFIGILVWGVLLGVFLHHAAETTKTALHDLSDAITRIVRVVIRLAPIGIFGLVAGNLGAGGLGELKAYGQLVTVLLGCMVTVALIANPLIVWVRTRRNPYPLIFTALRESGMVAFFTRSSAANIPVNLALCEKLDLEEDTYAVSIPLGATINMGGAAITITVLTLAAVHTLGISVDLPTALLLSVVAALSACGASGVPGGSLLLIPLACGLFGISNDVAMQVVSVGFVISILQDSAETALNSSTDVVFTAAVAAKSSPAS